MQGHFFTSPQPLSIVIKWAIVTLTRVRDKRTIQKTPIPYCHFERGEIPIYREDSEGLRCM